MVFAHWLVKLSDAANRKLIVKQVVHDSIADQRAKVEVVLAAGVLTNTTESLILAALRMSEAEPAGCQCVILVTLGALEGWRAAREHFQVDLKPTDALLVSQEAHQCDLVHRTGLQSMPREPFTMRRVV